MIELLLIAASAIILMMWYIKRLRAKNNELTRNVRQARRVTDYREKEAAYTRERLQDRDERVNERVEKSENEDYSDLFGPSDRN